MPDRDRVRAEAVGGDLQVEGRDEREPRISSLLLCLTWGDVLASAEVEYDLGLYLLAHLSYTSVSGLFEHFCPHQNFRLERKGVS